MVPLLSCFSCDPCNICSVTAQLEDPHAHVAIAMTLEGSVRNMLIHRHTSLHTAAREAIDILLYGGAEGWVGRWGLHCSKLAAEAQGKLERGRVCLSVSDRKWLCVSVRDMALVIGP